MASLRIPSFWLAGAIFFLIPHSAFADGCKYRFDGRLVPEREQRAVIEWTNGTETLYVAALGDPTSEANVWIVPVRADPKSIQAEPVDEFPTVTRYETVKRKAEERLWTKIGLGVIFDSGGLCCIPGMMFLGGGGGGGGGCGSIQKPPTRFLGLRNWG